MVATPRSLDLSAIRSSSFCGSIESDILEFDGQAVDAANRRRNPVRELAGLDDAAHQRLDVGMIGCVRQPVSHAASPFGFGDDAAIGGDVMAGELPDSSMKAYARQHEAK